MLSNFWKLIQIKGFRDEKPPKEEWIHLNFHDGGLGDHVCRLSAVKFLKEEYPYVKFTVWVPDFFLAFAKKAIPNVNWQKYSEAKHTLPMSQPPISAGSEHGVTSMGMHIVDHAFIKLADRLVPADKKNYVSVPCGFSNTSDIVVPEKYVVITTGYTAAVRELVPNVVNEITSFVKQAGYEVVFLGSTDAKVGQNIANIKGKFSNEIDFSAGLDLRNRTSIVEAHALIGNSKAIVGLDNGLLHLAACTEVPIVMGFTTVDPKLRVPYRHNELGWNTYIVTPPESLACRFCQSNMNFVYDHDFRTCYYEDYVCTKQATSAPYIEHLKKIL